MRRVQLRDRELLPDASVAIGDRERRLGGSGRLRVRGGGRNVETASM